MKSALLSGWLVLAAGPAVAQSQSHADVVAAVKQVLVARGMNLLGNCGAFEITKRVAWQLRGEGAGLLAKPDGEGCEGFAKDIIAYPSGMIVDILIASGDLGGNGPSWEIKPAVEASRWRPVGRDPDGVAPIPGPPAVLSPGPPPVAAPSTALSIDPATILERLAAIDAKQDALSLQLKAHDESPTWIRRFSSSPAGVAIYAFLGTCLPTKCWRVK